ncbi:uncharacterized protein TRIADDRAFT_54256 [Trichoplax adhaerens]|uniref:Uncharacterized protein n=1 Tax=Trichoplax adhaerens TaxID=10228 RepID=B3RRJ0_TRIAD|nr:hypothetical protein TRIADDRAFT_54256 [Trichoplax adhaerens]EDV26884.1 hypothetical protein TRIADDRAFT_54256 [Trichoplax adhaerens]|eukprot:XP_002110880.1 hypothetical protein TRIADDRAFT_54256 [Trichoplax adhaerens]
MDAAQHIQGNTVKYYFKGSSSKADVISAVSNQVMEENKTYTKYDPSRQLNLAKVQNQRENMILKEKISQLNREGAHRLSNISSEQKLFKKKQQNLKKSKITSDHDTANQQDNHHRHNKGHSNGHHHYHRHHDSNLPSISGHKICQEKTWIVVDYDNRDSNVNREQDLKRNIALSKSSSSTDIVLLPLENYKKNLVASSNHNSANAKVSNAHRSQEHTVKMPPIEQNQHRNNIGQTNESNRSSMENLPALISNKKDIIENRLLSSKRDRADSGNRKNNNDKKDEPSANHTHQLYPQINTSTNISGKITKADLKKNENLRKMMEELSKCTYLRHPKCNSDNAAFPPVLEIQSKPVWTLTG